MEIEISSQIELFNNHFSKAGNKNILFSAPFGYGKTYFLEKFFQEKKYKVFWLSPVKYIVSRNEDIFEYIKMDLALQLIRDAKIRNKNSLKFAEDIYLNEYLANEPTEAIRLLLEIIKESKIPAVEQISSMILKGFEAKDKFNAWKRKLEETQEGDYQKLYKYISSSSLSKGSIFEDDIITQVIRGSLLVLKETDKNDKHDNVLIIDDFDRLDPEHIFRILNILSVHQNYLPNEDKFGFDKIIVVCDVNNLRSIYEHKYGSGADFEGYMEKFYSDDIFNFNNQLAISKYCKENLQDEFSSDLISLIGYYLSFFVEQEELSIRSVKKTLRGGALPYSHKKYFAVKDDLSKIHEVLQYENRFQTQSDTEKMWSPDYLSPFEAGVSQFYIDIADFPVLEIIPVLIRVFGDFNSLKEVVNKYTTKSISFPIERTKVYVNIFLPLIYYIDTYNNSDYLLWHTESKTIREQRYGYNKNITMYSFPISNALLPGLKIPLGWNNENQYSGDIGYYSQVRHISIEDYQINEAHTSLEGKLLKFLQAIILFLEDNALLESLNVTK